MKSTVQLESCKTPLQRVQAAQRDVRRLARDILSEAEWEVWVSSEGGWFDRQRIDAWTRVPA